MIAVVQPDEATLNTDTPPWRAPAQLLVCNGVGLELRPQRRCQLPASLANFGRPHPN